MKQHVHRNVVSSCNAPSISKPGPRHSLSRLIAPGQPSSYQPAPEATRYYLQASEDVRQVVNSASQLASSPPFPSAGAASAGRGTGAGVLDMTAVRPLLAASVNTLSRVSSAQSGLEAEESISPESASAQSSLSSVFDEIQSELRSRSSALDTPESRGQFSVDPPKACRSIPQVLPRNVQEKPAHPVARLPELPRSIHIRPQLMPNFSTHIHPTDEWLLHPQPPPAVAARLRSGASHPPRDDSSTTTSVQLVDDPWYHGDLHPEPLTRKPSSLALESVPDDLHVGKSQEELPWTPGRLISLLRALSAAGYHATACELLDFLFETQGMLFSSLDLSRQAVLGCVHPFLVLCLHQPVVCAGTQHAHATHAQNQNEDVQSVHLDPKCCLYLHPYAPCAALLMNPAANTWHADPATA